MFCFNASFQSLASAPQCVSLSSLPSVPLLSHNHALKTNSHYRKIGRDVIVMATGDALAETEVLEFVKKTLQDAWDKVDDKYAVGSLVVASVIALWGSTGLISVGMTLIKLPRPHFLCACVTCLIRGPSFKAWWEDATRPLSQGANKQKERFCVYCHSYVA
ncbi:hypothetical protein P8452_55171 [Trifolium repens]|nr:hypothetical protein P8452_55171 [Trifolium repens]